MIYKEELYGQVNLENTVISCWIFPKQNIKAMQILVVKNPF